MNRVYTTCFVLVFCLSREIKAEEVVDMVIVGARTEVELQNIAADITVITAEEIEKSAASTLIEVLRGVASIQVADNATNTTISIRGFSAEQAGSNTLILVNGRRLNFSDLAAPQLATIQLSEILRIEILNSSAGVLYGDQAVGGVVNIITTQNRQPYTDLTATVASFDSSSVSLSTAINLDQKWTLLFSTRQNTTDNFRQHNEEEIQQHHLALNYQSESLGVIFAVDNTNQSINTPGALLEEDLLTSRNFSRAEFSSDFLDYETINYSLSSFFSFDENWLFEFELQNNEDDNRSLTSFINFQSTFESTTERSLISFTPRLSNKYQTKNGAGNFTLGVDYIETDYSFSLLGRANAQTSLSSYFHVLHPVFENLRFSGGARYAQVEDKLVDAFTYINSVTLKNKASAINLGLTYEVNPETQLFVTTEENFRFAKVDEQAYTSPGVIGLKPQLGVSIDFGIKTSFDDTRIKLSIYQLKLKDEISFDSSELPPLGAFFQGANVNSGRSTREGISLSIFKYLTEKLHLKFNSAWTDARFSSGLNDNIKIPGVAKNLYRLDIDYAFNDSRHLNFEYIYTGERKQDGDNGGFFEKLKSYSLLNLGYLHHFTGKLDHWRFSARVNNLLDKNYINFAQFNGFYPAPGLNGSLSIRYRFEN